VTESNRFTAEEILRQACSGQIPADGDFIVRGPNGWFFGNSSGPSGGGDGGGGDGGGGGGGATSFADLLGNILNFQVGEAAVTQHQEALEINYSQMFGFIPDSQVPLSAVIQYCVEIDECLGATIPGWDGNVTDLIKFLLGRDVSEATFEHVEDVDAALGALIPGWNEDLTTIVGWLIARDRQVTIKDNEINITISPAFDTLADVLTFLLGRATELPPPHTQIASNMAFC
jgi:hypothetical protein